MLIRIKPTHLPDCLSSSYNCSAYLKLRISLIKCIVWFRANSHFAHKDQLFLTPLFFVAPNLHPVLNNCSRRTNSGGIVNCPKHFASHLNWATLVTHKPLFPWKHALAAIQKGYYPFFAYFFLIDAHTILSVFLLPNNRVIIRVLQALFSPTHKSQRQLLQKGWKRNVLFMTIWGRWPLDRLILNVGINSEELKHIYSSTKS